MNIALSSYEKRLLDAVLLQYSHRFFLFGSRVKGTAKPYSDLDICIKGPITISEYATIKEHLNNAMLPFTIDLVVWDRLSEEFQKIITHELVAYTPDLLLGARIFDLTQEINGTSPTWTGECGFEVAITNDYDKTFRVQKFMLNAGIGTHIDSPAHITQGARDVSLLSIKDLIAPARIWHQPCNGNADFIITCDMLDRYEADYGVLQKGSWLVIMTGWGLYWSNQEKYRSVDDKGIMHFPSIDSKVADVCIKRDIAGIVIDTLSPDNPQAQTFFSS